MGVIVSLPSESLVRTGSVRAADPERGQSLRAVRPWFVANAVVVWVALLADAAVTVGDVYPTVGADAGDFGYHQADGLLGVLGRTVDFASYFTTWSLLAVAVVVTVMAVDPTRHGPVLRVARMTSILMITVTFVATTISYPVWFGAGGVLTGWLVPAHLLKHVAAPVLTLVVWAAFGPRGWISRATACWSLVVPFAWIAWTLARGAIIGAYPYPPINVIDFGYGGVLVNVAAVVAIGAVILALLVAFDAWLGRRHHGEQVPSAVEEHSDP